MCLGSQFSTNTCKREKRTWLWPISYYCNMANCKGKRNYPAECLSFCFGTQITAVAAAAVILESELGALHHWHGLWPHEVAETFLLMLADAQRSGCVSICVAENEPPLYSRQAHAGTYIHISHQIRTCSVFLTWQVSCVLGNHPILQIESAAVWQAFTSLVVP